MPGSGVPISWAGPSSSAASDVPARIAPIGVIPDSTRYAGSRRFVPCAAMPQSVPMATRTPRSMACGMCRRATVSQCFFFAYAQLVAFSGSGVGVRRGRCSPWSASARGTSRGSPVPVAGELPPSVPPEHLRAVKLTGRLLDAEGRAVGYEQVDVWA
ncbi:hypothetical protein OHU24_22125 [Streptomyces sp. NBC_00118]|nr:MULTISPECIES: hypothetical protein [unclassified Streptomyces]MCX5438524.1 hypothetical protein [Streptomyces sp. NBC_00063]WSE16153.1 hypothetical protein OG518_24005 [Streptomyces sp. NBC_01397]WUB94930.1 hypothetical protein OHO83_22905 [Streptomyces sp. NBC_00569]